MRQKYLTALCVTLSLFLGACATMEVVDYRQIDEEVTAMVFDPLGNTLYAAGSHYDYEITPCLGARYREDDGVDQRCQQTLKAMLSQPVSEQIRHVKLVLSIRDGSLNVVDGSYQAYVLADAETQAALSTSGLAVRKANGGDVMDVNKALSSHYKAEELMVLRVFFEGRVVTLADRDAVLQKGRLAQPLSVRSSVTTLRAGRSAGPIFKGVAGVVMVPVAVVAILPMAAVLSYCETGHRC